MLRIVVASKHLLLRNALAYFAFASMTKIKKLIDTWRHSYKTFYGRNLRIFEISESVCSWKSNPA
jgi:hypothetical protein